ncbi:hypothetical protein [Streptomyces sp. NPDC015125]|uniref:hypothetical protein n=1 Tax=Streptomyces sp. NPDC015125 TaxID=3364938 RepID=UPI0036FEF655
MPEPPRNCLITKSPNPVDLLNAAARLFGGSITTSPLDGLRSGDHELRGRVPGRRRHPSHRRHLAPPPPHVT